MTPEIPREYTIDFFLTAAECDAQQEMSMTLMVQRLIDIATAHANVLGVGYERLIRDNTAWVLSRMSVEVKRLPSINEAYSLTTWVEAVNRHFSERNIEIRDGKNEVIGYARLIWVAINIDTRRPADLTPLMPLISPSDRVCPIERQPRLPAVTTPDAVEHYTFRFSDIDFNRHVNSGRYVEMILNCHSLDFFDKNRITRLDIAYQAEAHFDDTVDIRRAIAGDTEDVEITREGATLTRARLHYAPRT